MKKSKPKPKKKLSPPAPNYTSREYALERLRNSPLRRAQAQVQKEEAA